MNDPIADKYLNKTVRFHSGNFYGLTGLVTNVERSSDFMFGVRLTFQLSDGRIGYAQKSEHFKLLK